jgi:hypothetical protein
MKNIFTLLLVFSLCWVAQSPAFGQNQTNNLKSETDAAQLNVLIKKIGERVKENLDSMFSVAFSESIRMQELKADMSAKGRQKHFFYESILTNRPASANAANYQPVFIRTLKSINGKPIKGQTSVEVSKCEETNPQPTYEDPLAFLLPKNQSNYIFSYGGEANLEGRESIVLFVSEKPVSEPLAVVEKDDCLFLSRPLQIKGKIWVDSKTYDVIQTQWEQAENFSTVLPKKTVKKGIIPLLRPAVTLSYDKQDFTIRFRRVKFENPDQTLLLPYSSESVWITKGMKLEGMRTEIEYTRYRTFKTNVEVNDLDKAPNP